MTRPWPARLLGLVVAGACALAACTPSSPDPSEPPPTSEAPTVLRPGLTLPSAPTTVLRGSAADLAVAASSALFDSAPVAVLAPTEDLAAQAAAASAAVSLGAPLLLVGVGSPAVALDDGGSRAQPPDWQAELDRLAVVAVVAVQLAPSRVAALGVEVVPGDDLPSLLDAPADTWTAGEEVATVAALDRGRAVALVAADRRGPPADDAPTPASLPATSAAEPAGDGVLLTDGDPRTLAAVATARAAGLAVVTVPEADPRVSSEAVQALAAAAGEDTRVLAVGDRLTDQDPAELDWRVRTAATGVELPGGGQVVFPGRRMVAMYGSPGIPALGLLGEQVVDAAVVRAKDLAGQYQALTDEPVVPGFEIIATIASAGPGADGNYSEERDVALLLPWVEAAQAAGVYVILDLQPGRTDFLTQAQLYEPLLVYPNVGLALDPEWRLKPDQVHLRQIGSVSAAEINTVSAWLAALTRERRLPQKVLVLHQFTLRMITERETLELHPELATVLHVDGQGTQGGKAGTWAALRRDAPAGLWWGWKNFIDEDVPMLTPEQTYQVQPVPDLVTYQ